MMRVLVLFCMVILTACSKPTAQQYKNAEKYCQDRGMDVWQNIDTNQISCVLRRKGEWSQFYDIPDSVMGDRSK